MDDHNLETIKQWAEKGGRVLAFEGGVKAFADQDGFDMKTKESPPRDEKEAATAHRKPSHQRQRDGLSDGIPGAIVRCKVDNSHPLAFGLPDYYHSLKTVSEAFKMPKKADVPIYLEEEFPSYGFIGSRLKPTLKNTPIAVVQKMGKGEAVLFVDNPLFRSFWQQGKMLFANALFF